MTENMEARIKEIIADPKLTYPQRLIERRICRIPCP